MDDKLVNLRNNKPLYMMLQRFKNKVDEILRLHTSDDLKVLYKKFHDFVGHLEKTDISSVSKESELWKMLIRIIMAIKMTYAVFMEDVFLTDIMAEYITFKCKEGILKKKDVTANIILTLNTIFNKNVPFIHRTLLKVNFLPEYFNILNPVFTKFMIKVKPQDDDFESYIRSILYCRKWSLYQSQIEKEKIIELAINILGKKVPPIQIEFQNFISISDLIKFSINRGNKGTRILLTNESLDLKEAIEKYFIKYKRYMNGYDAGVVMNSLILTVSITIAGLYIKLFLYYNFQLSLYKQIFSSIKNNSEQEIE